MSSVLQAIPGVSAREENTVMTIYPSMGGDGIGKLISTVFNSIPVPLWPLKKIWVSHLLFGPLLLPIALKWYLIIKVFGNKYVITNRRVQVRTAVPLVMGDRLQEEILLGEIKEIRVEQSKPQEFLKCADLHLIDAKDNVALMLTGVPYPQIAIRNILETRDARSHVEAAIAHIEAR